MDVKVSLAALEQLLRVSDVGKRLSLSRPTLYRLMENGTLPYVRFGRSRRIKESDVAALIERNTVARQS